MKPSEVLEKIESAFKDIKRPNTSLRQYFFTDQKGLSSACTIEEWDNAGKSRVDLKWQDIADSEIQEFDCLLGHMQAHEFQYYLPAYMCYSIKHYQDPIWKNGILGSTVFAVFPSQKDRRMYEYSLSQLSLLNDAQNQAIITFLEFVTEYAHDLEKPDALQALESYWYEL